MCHKLFRNTQKAHFRHGRRADKTTTSFHKNNIFVKTRKVMGNTDVAHYQGRRSIYNICILNYCKLTFEFFKNYIFEKRRQFLNRVISATDGGVQKHYRVFRTKNSKFKNWQGCQFLNRVRAAPPRKVRLSNVRITKMYLHRIGTFKSL